LRPRRHRRDRCLSWDEARFRVLYETTYRAVWVTRSRHGVIVSESPSRCSSRLRRPPACTNGSSSRALAIPSRVLGSTPARMLTSGHLPWASVPHRGINWRSPQPRASHCPLRSVLDVSHVPDGFLLRQPLRVCFAPQPRPGFALQGLPLAPSRTSSSLAVALLSLPAAPAEPPF
jgi:hypothetical protein